MGLAKKPVRLLAASILAAKGAELDELFARYGKDSRRGVQKAFAQALKGREREEKEIARVATLYKRAQSLGGKGFVLGVDEVGRGAIAGPLTVCALALPPTPHILGLNDSKQLTPRQRERLAVQVREAALAWGIYHVSPRQIDQLGLALALRKAASGAIRLAQERYGKEPDAVLLDGRPLGLCPQERAVVQGDATLAPVAAASIVAKVARDALLQRADEIWPGYSLASSKGYGTKAHLAALSARGLTPYHRRSFCCHLAKKDGGARLF